MPQHCELLPGAQQLSSPLWSQHTWFSWQVAWRQVMLLWAKQVQREVQVLSGYQLSPTYGVVGSAGPPDLGSQKWAQPSQKLGGILCQMGASISNLLHGISSPAQVCQTPSRAQGPRALWPVLVHTPVCSWNKKGTPCRLVSHRVVEALGLNAATLVKGHAGGSAQDVAFPALAAFCTGQRGQTVLGVAQAEAGGRAGPGTGAVGAIRWTPQS